MHQIFPVALSLLGAAPLAFGHGSMADPISRVYQVYLENPESPDSASSAAALAVNGTQPFYDWHEVNRNVTDGDYEALIPDGQIPGAGREKYAGLNLLRDDWPASHIAAGPYEFVFSAHVPHDPSFFIVYITRPDYDPLQAVGWDDLELLDDNIPATLAGGEYRFTVDLPAREGRHGIYVIWQRIDPAGEAFFSWSDVVFGEDDGNTTPPVNPPAGPLSDALDFYASNAWDGGFIGNMTLTNPFDQPLPSWRLEFDLPAEITSLWNGQIVSRDGNRYVVENASWNAVLGVGSSVSFGFQASGDATGLMPTNVVLNGVNISEDYDHGDHVPADPPADDGPDEPGDHAGHDDSGNEPDPGGDPGDDSRNDTGGGDAGGSPADDALVVDIVTDWGSGFTASATLTNTGGAAINGWRLSFDADYQIDHIWNAVVVGEQQDGRYTLENASWNGFIAAGDSISFGFNGSPGEVSGVPANVTIEGAPASDY